MVWFWRIRFFSHRPPQVELFSRVFFLGLSADCWLLCVWSFSKLQWWIWRHFWTRGNPADLHDCIVILSSKWNCKWRLIDKNVENFRLIGNEWRILCAKSNFRWNPVVSHQNFQGTHGGMVSRSSWHPQGRIVPKNSVKSKLPPPAAIFSGDFQNGFLVCQSQI